MNHRLISFGGTAISIAFQDGRPAELVDFLFRHVPASPPREPWTTLRIERQPEATGFTLWQDDTRLATGEPDTSMAHSLMSQACFTLAYDGRDGLMLHAAGARHSGQTILLPGKSGAGKSTLTAWLLAHGGRYLTDELLYVAEGSDLVRGFARPLTIKPSARHLLPGLLKVPVDDPGILRAGTADMIHPPSFGSDLVSGDSPPGLIIFPTYQEECQFELRPLSTAQAAFELMSFLANARNLAGHGLPQAIRLAGAAPAYSLTFSDLEQAGRSIIDLLR